MENITLGRREINGAKKKVNKIKGILIDSGRVLNYPATGDWSFSPNFFNIVNKSKFYNIPRIKRKAAYKKAWPSLREVFKKAEVYKYFDSLIISSELGVTKPSPQMYKAALKELDLNEEEVVYIDDNFINCNGALQLGIKSIILNRDLKMRIFIKIALKSKHKIIKNLHEAEKLVMNL